MEAKTIKEFNTLSGRMMERGLIKLDPAKQRDTFEEVQSKKMVDAHQRKLIAQENAKAAIYPQK